MKWNTRFNPTVNGPLHLGHLYTILVNQGEAKASGGKFGVRFDDTQRAWNWKFGHLRVECYREGMKEDLAWLGIEPDFYECQSEMMEKVGYLLALEFHYAPKPELFGSLPAAEVIGIEHVFYPYTDRLTAEKAIMDCLEGVNWLIRGMDMLPEDCLYSHFCERFLIGTPRRTYIPRLQTGTDEVSKTAGKFKIEDFRKARFEPTELLNLLRHDCLTQDYWRVEFVRATPALGTWAEEALHGLHS